MNIKKQILIKCPKCGREYLPAEIFYPKSLLGNPSNIFRDDAGHIIYFDGESMNLTESFECENCRCQFDVSGDIKFTSIVDKIHDFSDDEDVFTFKAD